MPLITLMNAHAAWGDLPLLDDADLSIEPGERVGLIGRNGTGKSTLLSILAGHTHLDDGELRVQDGLRVLYVEQEPVLPEAANVKESLILRGKLDKIEDEREHWRRLAKLDECLMKFELDPERSVARVSGGERKRAALALAFALEPDLLLLDEPTNHLDIASKEILEDALNSYNGTVLYVSHDRYFINRTAHRILELSGGTLHQYLGNYDYYLEKKSQQGASTESAAFGTLATSAASAASTESSASKLSWQAQKEKEAQRRKKENALKKCEEQIASLEERDKQIDLEMSDPKIATDVAALQKLSREKDEIADKLMELMEEWEQLSE